MERFCTFTNMEPLKSHMNELFPVLKRILVDVTADPHRTSWLFPHGSTHETIEAIMRLKDYTTMQTAKMVRYLLYVIFVFHISLFLTYSSWFFMKNCSQDPQFDEITLSFFWTVESNQKNQGVHGSSHGLLERVVGQARENQSSLSNDTKSGRRGHELAEKNGAK